jgi:RNA polymerase sigma-70 factor (ECF subfamily)
LVALLAEGDQHALGQFYDRTNRIVYGLALRILGDPALAEDVSMEVYMQVWRTAGNYDPDRVHLRDSRPDPELASVEDMRSRTVHKAMSQLSPDQRQAIELAYFYGLSHSEVAVRTDLPLGTIKTRIRLGMLHLRKLLG